MVTLAEPIMGVMDVAEVSIGHRIRGTHPYCFKSGEWGLIIGLQELNGRLCFNILWRDGAVDDWPVDDPVAGYEFDRG